MARKKAAFELRVTQNSDESTQYTLRDLRTGDVLYQGSQQAVALTELRRVDPDFMR